MSKPKLFVDTHIMGGTSLLKGPGYEARVVHVFWDFWGIVSYVHACVKSQKLILIIIIIIIIDLIRHTTTGAAGNYNIIIKL